MANVIEFTIKGVDKGSNVLGSFSKAAGSTIKVAAKFTAGVAAAGTAVFAMTAKVNDSLDKHAKFAKRIGVSVSELTALQHAAEMSSIPITQFNMATQRMTRRVAEAAQGTGEAAGALVELGINADDFNRKGLDEQMSVLADRMSTVGSESDQLRLAFKLFDSEGTAMLQMLKDGSPAMRAAAEDARYLGTVLGKEAAANAEEFGNQMTRLQASIKGVTMGVSEELTPLFTGMMASVVDMIAQARPQIVAFVKDSVSNIATIGVVIGQVYDSIRDFLSKVFSEEGFNDFVKGAKAAMSWVVDLFMQSGPLLAKTLFSSFKVIWEGFTELAQWGFDSMMDIFTGEDVSGTLAETLFKKIPQATAETREEVAQMWNDLGAFSIEKGTEISGALAETFGINVELARIQADEMVAGMERFGEVAEEKTAEIQERQTTFLDAFYAKNAEFMATQQEMSVQLAEQTHDIMISSIDSISNAIGQAIANGADLMDALSAIGKQVAADLISMLVKTGIQHIATSMVAKSASASQASAELSKGAATTYMNAFSSTAAIPVVGPAMAPAVAAGALAAATAGSTAAAATGASLGAGLLGQAHDGMDYVPREGTFLLDKGERVIQPEANKDLTAFLNGTGGEESGSGLVIENLNVDILPNVTDARSIMDLPPEEIKEAVASAIIPALDALARQGVKPQYLLES